MEKLNLPAWYNDRTPPPINTSSFYNAPTWKRTTQGYKGRRTSDISIQRSKQVLRSSTLSLCSSSNYSSSPSPSLSSRPIYLGWRSQDRLDIGPLYLASPSQRLASTVVSKLVKETQKDSEESIAEADDKTVPSEVKEAWPEISSDSETDGEVCDDDSGIDRSDDFVNDLLEDVYEESTKYDEACGFT